MESAEDDGIVNNPNVEHLTSDNEHLDMLEDVLIGIQQDIEHSDISLEYLNLSREVPTEILSRLQYQ
jgi:hypothetical protein